MSLVTPAEVRGWSTTEAADPLIQIVIDAVEVHAATCYDLPDPLPADAKLALLMQVSRLLRRRKTPEGVATFGTEIALRVNRFDPDINDLMSSYEKALIA